MVRHRHGNDGRSFYTQILRNRRHGVATQGHVGNHQGRSGGRRSKEKGWAESLLLWFLWEGMGKVTSLNNFKKLQEVGTTPYWLISVPGVIRTGDSGFNEGEFDKGGDKGRGGVGHGLQVGWFAYERHICRRVICYLYKLASSERDCLPLVSEASDARTARIRKIRKYS